MNCTIIQRWLLSAEQPEQPSAEIQGHLAQCPPCRAWHRRLVQMEQQIPQLPVPPSTAREQFLQRLAGVSLRPAGTRTSADSAPLWRSPLLPGPKERALRKVSLAFALAASLLVFALAWWSWPHEAPPVAEATRHDQVRLEERLSNSLRGETPKERVLSLATLAEEVHGEARSLADNSDKLEQWARFYTRLVGEQLVEQARQLSPDDRPAVLQGIAERLSRAESDASRWEAQFRTTSPRSAASFRQMALVSRNSERNLRTLLNS